MAIITLKIPVDQIAEAVKISRNAIGAQKRSIEEESNRMPHSMEEIERLSGSRGVQEAQQLKEQYQAERRKIQEKAIAEIEALEVDAKKYIDDEVTPNGKDIVGENAGDFALLEHNLIPTPEMLRVILDKHDNTAFRMAAEQYAKRQNWDGFTFYDKEKSVREYTDQVFTGVKMATRIPAGMYALQYTQQADEFRRIANAYGIGEEFTASGGEKIENLFIR